MLKKFFICLIAFCSTTIVAQTKDSLKTRRIGIIGTADLAYNFQDKVLTPGLGRKLSAGVSFTNKKRQFIVFVAGDFKGAKGNLHASAFRESFINDVRQHYLPISGTSEDSLIGAKVNSNTKESLSGTYAQYLQVGFILNKKLKPSFSFYAGHEDFLLSDPGFTKYEDPKYQDIHYVSMTTTFYELKVGCAIPLKLFSGEPFCLNVNIGYKWVDYGELKFNGTPLNAYTSGSLKDKYSSCGKMTLSVSFLIWSNWHFGNK